MTDSEQCATTGHTRGKEFCTRCATKLPTQTLEESLEQRICLAVEQLEKSLRMGSPILSTRYVVEALYILTKT